MPIGCGFRKQRRKFLPRESFRLLYPKISLVVLEFWIYADLEEKKLIINK